MDGKIIDHRWTNQKSYWIIGIPITIVANIQILCFRVIRSSNYENLHLLFIQKRIHKRNIEFPYEEPIEKKELFF